MRTVVAETWKAGGATRSARPPASAHARQNTLATGSSYAAGSRLPVYLDSVIEVLEVLLLCALLLRIGGVHAQRKTARNSCTDTNASTMKRPSRVKLQVEAGVPSRSQDTTDRRLQFTVYSSSGSMCVWSELEA